VLTAKHCDGFLLWHSQASGYNISRTPFQRDICAELANAARAQSMRLGWYFSPMDWRDPDFRTERNAEFLGRMQAELHELLSDYGPIDLLWFDWDGHEPLYDQAHTYELVKNLQPRAIINNRLDLAKATTTLTPSTLSAPARSRYCSDASPVAPIMGMVKPISRACFVTRAAAGSRLWIKNTSAPDFWMFSNCELKS
jgi:hypothetical protein